MMPFPFYCNSISVVRIGRDKRQYRCIPLTFNTFLEKSKTPMGNVNWMFKVICCECLEDCCDPSCWCSRYGLPCTTSCKRKEVGGNIDTEQEHKERLLNYCNPEYVLRPKPYRRPRQPAVQGAGEGGDKENPSDEEGDDDGDVDQGGDEFSSVVLADESLERMRVAGLEVDEEEGDDDFSEGNDLFNPYFSPLAGLVEGKGLLDDEEEDEEDGIAGDYTNEGMSSMYI
jgi:hypothetical protein